MSHKSKAGRLLRFEKSNTIYWLKKSQNWQIEESYSYIWWNIQSIKWGWSLWGLDKKEPESKTHGICTTVPESKTINLADLSLPETKRGVLL